MSDNGSNIYSTIFNDNCNNDSKNQEKLSPYLHPNNKANSFPEMNLFYPTFNNAEISKKDLIPIENVIILNQEEQKLSKLFIFIKIIFTIIV